ncbi:MAG: sulfotransferase [Anaerolineales bacterium]|nr:sulfotransferase [Anaerolineales bacterium]MCB8989444.1 sulfotransferase [Ardenticatenaceae bacterium]MCB9005018.1 sulfotransferase [Ardenticatenaceae bacterium]
MTIENPVFIIGCPRSGTTLLYNILSEAPELWSIGTESKHIIEQHHHPREKNWESGELTAADVTTVSRTTIPQAFRQQAAPGTFWQKINRARGWLRRQKSWRQLKQRGRTTQSGASVSSAIPQAGMDRLRQLVTLRNQWLPGQPDAIRLLEKTPENCLRLPFLLELFPDGRIIYLIRDGRDNINSLLNGWREPHLFPGYPVPDPLHIPGYQRPRWAFSLIPGWRDLVDRPLAEICARQWIACNEAVLTFQQQSSVPILTIRLEELVAQPAATLPHIADFLQIENRESLMRHGAQLPQINVTSRPTEAKWQQNEAEIRAILPFIQPMMAQLGYESSV